MKLCLHRCGAQPRRKKIKKKQPPRVLTFRERLDLERATRRERIRSARFLDMAQASDGLSAAVAGLLGQRGRWP